jgi:hypothetical protein
MAAFRATIMTAGAASLLLCSAPASAQIDEAAVNILRECARIDDPTARLACYDNNIRGVGGMARSTIPGQSPRPEGGSAPVGASSPQGFGFESVRTPQRFERPAEQLNEILIRVTGIRPREPGIYLITLEDGAQWQFSQSVGRSYRLPRSGSVVEIQRGALGSFLMRYDGQPPVAMRRVR